MEARVNDFVAGVGQHARDDLGPTVMPVEARFGDDDAQLAERRGHTVSLSQLRRRDCDGTGRPCRR